MADTKISELPAATSVGAADLIPIVQGGVNKKATADILGTMQVASVTLTDAQIKALATVDVVYAPGVNKYLKFIGGSIILDNTAGAYTNVTSPDFIVLRTGQAAVVTNCDAVTLEDNSNIWVYDLIPPASTGQWLIPSECENLAIQISVSNGSGTLTGGNAANTLKVTVYYVVVDL